MQDHERFTLLWTAAQPVVGSYIGSVVPDFRDAEDLLQEVALVLLRKFPEYDPSRPFVAWAMGIAKYQLLNSRRRFARSLLLADSDLMEHLAATYIENTPELDRRASALRECLSALKGRAAELIRLRYEEALKPEAIAGRLGTAATAIRMALSRTRALLRECIQRKMKIAEERV